MHFVFDNYLIFYRKVNFKDSLLTLFITKYQLGVY
jgi:hypothetical protein